MLDFMRKNANSSVMVFLFGIIIFVFAVNFGPWAGGKISASDTFAAKVNKESLGLSEFRTAYVNQIARIKQFRPDYDEAQAERDGIKRMILDRLIDRELLAQMIHGYGISVSPKVLALEIRSRIFGEEEEFSKEEYKRRVNGYFQSGLAQFENQVKKDIVAETMSKIFASSLYIPKKELEEEYINKNTQVSIEFIKINPKFFAANKEFSKEDKDLFIKDHKDLISNYYNKNISDYVKEEQVHASHILLKVDPKADEAEKNKKKQKALEILSQLKEGKDFASIASAESEDLATKSKGGDLGYFSYSMMVEQFSKKAFSLAVQQISDIVETPFGFHIIKVLDKRPAEKRELNDVSEQIANKLLNEEEQNKKAKEFGLKALAQLKNNTNLEKITLANLINKKNGSTKNIQVPANAPLADETEMFNLSSSYIPKLGQFSEVVDKAFLLKNKQEVFNDLILSNEQYFAIRLKDRKEADMSKFNEEKENFENRLSYPRQHEFSKQYLSYLKKRAKIIYNEGLIKQADMSI